MNTKDLSKITNVKRMTLKNFVRKILTLAEIKES